MTVAGGEARGEEVMTWTSGDTVVTIVVTGDVGSIIKPDTMDY